MTCPNGADHLLSFKPGVGFECAECHIPVKVIEVRPDQSKVEVRDGDH